MTLTKQDTTVPFTKYIVNSLATELPFHDYYFGRLYWRADYTAAVSIQIGYIEYDL